MTLDELYAKLNALGVSAWVDVENPSDVFLDGWFTLPALEAIVAYLKAKQE